ncbi:FAD-dependent oxidoreductase [Orrella sp. JC864]|uniref:NAD(P)/FAD-dependent oxidoreductase n=1 Tax=Orrella sp. JC864 TaxID=3120298 RepID=UPI0012BB661B
MPEKSPPHRVVIVGGGAGGLELAARLGRRYGPQAVTLVDARPLHVWKPSLHEAAAGTMDVQQEGLSYLMLARLNRFTFVLGSMLDVDRQARTLRISAVATPDGEQVVPERMLSYDTLVLAIGSTSHFFGTPGAEQHAVTLDTVEQAERFRLLILQAMVKLNEARRTDPQAKLDLVIVGGGATGVELSVELYEAGHVVSAYGLSHFRPERDMTLTLLEGGPRILGALPERISEAAMARLAEVGVRVHTDCRVSEVAANEVRTADGRSFPASLCMWAAGIRGLPVAARLGLPQNRIGQIEVDARLHTEDPHILAMGDCAAAPWRDGRTVPARAQAAHQQAEYLAELLGARIAGRPEPQKPYVYQDHGSLVSLGQDAGAGSLMGKLTGKGLFVSGTLARLMYMSLHLMHHRAVLGVGRTATLALARLLMRRTQPRVKLH